MSPSVIPPFCSLFCGATLSLMRVLTASLVVVVVGAGVASAAFPSALHTAWDSGAAAAYRALYERAVRIEGAGIVTAAEIERLLPRERSTVEWLVEPMAVEARVATHPLVRRARVRPCSRWLVNAWGCFVVEVEERVPAYIATVGRELWALGNDGAFLAPVGKDDDDLGLKLLRTSADRPRVLRGLTAGNAAPTVVTARFQYLQEAIGIIEKETEQRVQDVTLEGNGELTVLFRDAGFRVRFDAAAEDPAKLRVESQRLRELLSELRSELARVAQIDLAYDRLAVVKFNDS